MRTIRWALGATALGMLPLAGCTTVLSPSPGAAYGSSSPAPGASSQAPGTAPAKPAAGHGAGGGTMSAAKARRR